MADRSIKGVILAGGTGSRLLPLTKVTNKHLLPVGRKPMIYYPIEQMLSCGIKDILIVTGREHMGDVVNLLGSGSDFGCEFTYRVQDAAGGIAQALYLAKGFIDGGRMLVILGDNIFGESLRPYFLRFVEQGDGARVLLKEVENPQRFGVAEIAGDRIVSIEEKPSRPKSRYAVTGAYMYDSRAFEFIEGLKPSGRGELEITDLNNRYVAEGAMRFDILSCWWTDAGTFESLAHANALVSTEGVG